MYGLALWLSWWRIHLLCRRPGFDPWVGKIPWRKERLPTPVFWPAEFHRLYSAWGRKESDTTKGLSHTHVLSYIIYCIYGMFHSEKGKINLVFACSITLYFPSSLTWSMDINLLASLCKRNYCVIYPRFIAFIPAPSLQPFHWWVCDMRSNQKDPQQK